MHMPIIEEVVNCETDLPEMSPTLFLLANLRLIWARLAAASKKQMFLPALAVDASKRKWFGKASAEISM